MTKDRIDYIATVASKSAYADFIVEYEKSHDYYANKKSLFGATNLALKEHLPKLLEDTIRYTLLAIYASESESNNQ